MKEGKDSRSALNTLDHDINRLHEISKTISETSLSLRDHITLHQEYVELEKNTRSALKKVEDGEIENFQAPLLAIQYYDLDRNAKLSDLIIAVRNDEQKHSEVNHSYADNYS